MFIGEKIGFWFKNARPVSLPQSLLPAAVALGLAASQRPAEFSLFWGLLAVLGVALLNIQEGYNFIEWFYVCFWVSFIPRRRCV